MAHITKVRPCMPLVRWDQAEMRTRKSPEGVWNARTALFCIQLCCHITWYIQIAIENKSQEAHGWRSAFYKSQATLVPASPGTTALFPTMDIQHGEEKKTFDRLRVPGIEMFRAKPLINHWTLPERSEQCDIWSIWNLISSWALIMHSSCTFHCHETCTAPTFHFLHQSKWKPETVQNTHQYNY